MPGHEKIKKPKVKKVKVKEPKRRDRKAFGSPTGMRTAAAAASDALAKELMQNMSIDTDDSPEVVTAKKGALDRIERIRNADDLEDQSKMFKKLLREWHPDKNSERVELATAVFQMLQKFKF